MRIHTWIGAAACALAIGASAPASAASNNLGLQIIPFTVNNSSGEKSKLYVYVTGQVPSQGNAWYYLSNKNGDLAPVQEMPQPKSISLDLGSAKTAKLKLPQLTGMRIYFSFGKPIKITAGANKVPGVPSGWTTTDPNYNTVFDWTEFTWVDVGNGNTSLGGNATQVDMFGLAMFIELKGVGPDFKTAQTLKSGFSGKDDRSDILSDMAKAPNPWRKLVLEDGKGNPLRAISPYNSMNNGKFPKNELQGYINDVYMAYQNKTVKVSTAGHSYSGRVTGNNLVFTQSGGPSTFTMPKPTTQAAFMGSIGWINSNNDTDAGAVAALMQGGLMRTTMASNANLNSCNTKQFYKNDPVNEYAEIIHQYAYKHLAYAFGYDDTCEQSSYIGIYNPKSITITLQPL